MSASCIAVAVLCGFLVLRERRDVASALADFDKRASVCERTCADAVGVARALADEAARFSGVSTNADGSPPALPVLQGYGQTRSRVARYIYADYRNPDGSIDRRYVARLPLRGVEGAKSPPIKRASEQSPGEAGPSKHIAPEGAITALDN